MMTPQLRFKEFTEDWSQCRLGNISAISGGYAFNSKKMSSNGEFQVIKMSNIYKGILDLTRNPSFLSNLSKREKEYFLKVDDIVLTLTGTVGKTDYGYSVIIEESDKYLLNQRLALLRAKENTSDAKFIFQLLRNPRFLYFFFAESKGGTGNQSNVGTVDLGNIKLYLPSLPEQQKIASFLTSVDKRISQLKRKKQLLAQYKKGIIQQIFSQQLRFKRDDGTNYPNWEKKRIGDIFQVTRGNVLKASEAVENRDDINCFPVYSSQTKENGLMGFYNEYLYEDAITWTTDGANAGDVKLRKGKFYCTNVCGVLISKEGYANQTVAEILNLVTHKYVSYVGNPKLMNNVMSSILIQVPSSVAEQTKIANFLSAIDTKITQTQKQIELTQQFKKGLLQQMFV